VTYGGDSGNRIFVLYWRCPLIRVSVIRGSTLFVAACCLSSAAGCETQYSFLVLHAIRRDEIENSWENWKTEFEGCLAKFLVLPCLPIDAETPAAS
jgi:hypothetical protein